MAKKSDMFRKWDLHLVAGFFVLVILFLVSWQIAAFAVGRPLTIDVLAALLVVVLCNVGIAIVGVRHEIRALRRERAGKSEYEGEER